MMPVDVVAGNDMLFCKMSTAGGWRLIIPVQLNTKYNSEIAFTSLL